MKTLALDLGTTTGWALFVAPSHIVSGTMAFKPGRYEGGGMRYLRFRRWVADMIAKEGVQVVFFEEVRRHLSTDSAHVYGGLLAQLTATCEELAVPYQAIPVGTIKKHATGKGNAGKEMMIEAMKAKGHNVSDDNEADALAILYCALEG